MGLLPVGDSAPVLSLEHQRYFGKPAKDVGRHV